MGVTFNPLEAGHPVIAALATLTLILNTGFLVSILYYAASKNGFSISWVEETFKPFLAGYYKEISLVLALTATSGSLYMSNILGWTPCRLCWFQRIIIYPMVALTAVAILLEKEDIRDYVIPLALIGLPIAVYHALVQRYSQFHSSGCSILQVSCSTKYTFFFGYVTIPVMAATVLVAILVLMWKFSE